jgi:hypothetical protein
MIMLPGLASSTAASSAQERSLDDHAQLLRAGLVSVVWVIVGFTWRSGLTCNGLGLIGGLDFALFNGVGLEPSTVYASTCRSCCSRLPADVRGDHAGPHHRRLRRAQAVRRVRPVHDPLVDPRLLPDRALGLVADGWLFKLGLPWTSRLAPVGATSARASRP